MDYAWQKLSGAVKSLVGRESIQQRVANAGQGLITLEPENFNDEDRELFTSIMDRLTTRQDPERGSIEASAMAMDDDAAESLAEDIAGLLNAHTLSYFVAQKGR
jgi:hypothetical protein